MNCCNDNEYKYYFIYYKNLFESYATDKDFIKMMELDDNSDMIELKFTPENRRFFLIKDVGTNFEYRLRPHCEKCYCDLEYKPMLCDQCQKPKEEKIDYYALSKIDMNKKNNLTNKEKNLIYEYYNNKSMIQDDKIEIKKFNKAILLLEEIDKSINNENIFSYEFDFDYKKYIEDMIELGERIEVEQLQNEFDKIFHIEENEKDNL